MLSGSSALFINTFQVNTIYFNHIINVIGRNEVRLSFCKCAAVFRISLFFRFVGFCLMFIALLKALFLFFCERHIKSPCHYVEFLFSN